MMRKSVIGSFIKWVLVIASILSISVVMPAFAVGIEDDYSECISNEEFVETIKREYRKYGFTVEIDTSGATVPLTKELLTCELDRAQRIADSFTIISGEPKVIIQPKSVSLESNITPYVMPCDFYYANSFTVACKEYPLYGTAKFDCLMKGTIDVQSANIMWVDYFNVGHVSSQNMDNYDLSAEYKIRDLGEIMATIHGNINFVWVEPHTNVTYKATKSGIFFADTFNAGKYI